jgi:ribose transport system substrate-binding protein
MGRSATPRQGRPSAARMLAVVACVVGVATLTACGDSDTDSDESASAQSGGGNTLDYAETKTGKAAEDFNGNMADLCGDKPLTVGYSAATTANAWSQISQVEFEDEAAKCSNFTVKFVQGNGDTQQQIANIKALTAQGVEALITYPQSGPVLLPALGAAFKSGVTVVPFLGGEDFGTVGTDISQNVTDLVKTRGEAYGSWLVEALNGEGNVVFLGGIPGNVTSTEILDGIKESFEGHPDMKLLVDRPVDTNWDPAQGQKAMAGLLTKYPEIDGVAADYGLVATGAMRAFEAANRPLVPFASENEMEFICSYDKYKSENPDFEIAASTARSWYVRLALRKAVARAQGISNPEPSMLDMSEPVTDSLDSSKAPECDPALPPDAPADAQLTEEQLSELFGK